MQGPNLLKSGTGRSIAHLVFAMLVVGVSGMPALSAENPSGTGEVTVHPKDDNQTSAATIRKTYQKRFPYAASQDTVENQESTGGTTESYEAYTQVRQYCIGGYLKILNELNDQLLALNEALQAVASPEDLARLKQQASDIKGMNREDLETHKNQQNGSSDFVSSGSLVGNPLYTQHQIVQGQINQIVNNLNSLGDMSQMSTITDDKACCFKTKFDIMYNPLLHYFYVQDKQTGSVEYPTKRDQDSINKGKIKTYGLPLSDTQFQIIDRENKQRLLEMMFDPERMMWKETMGNQIATSSMANSMGGAAESSFKSAYNQINENLINIANENATAGGGGAGGGGGGGGSDSGVMKGVRLVQQMYKWAFLPMAVLLLLPGTLLTQLKGLVTRSAFGEGEDASSPFEGLIRATIAIFLIPATQLFISYAIDIGNSMANAVRDPAKNWIQESTLMNWVKEQTFQPAPSNVHNAILPPTNSFSSMAGSTGGMTIVDTVAGDGGGGGGGGRGGAGRGGAGGAGGGGGPGVQFNVFSGNSTLNNLLNALFNHFFGSGGNSSSSSSSSMGGGKALGMLEGQVKQEDQSYLASTLQLGFNSAAYLMGYSLSVLAAYQLVLMCYLFLLGPIAAALFAWPAGVGQLFRKVFGSWMDGVVVLCLWRFYWCVILAIMTQRIAYLHPDPSSPWEMMIYNCFMMLLVYIPFQPFDFRPGNVAAKLLQDISSGGGK